MSSSSIDDPHIRRIAARLQRRAAAAAAHNRYGDDGDDEGESTSATPILLSNAQVAEMLQARIDARCLRNAREAASEQQQQQTQTATAAAAAATTKSSSRRRALLHRHRDWIESHVVQYVAQQQQQLSSTDNSSGAPLPRRLVLSVEQSVALQERITAPRFGLTEAEALQVLNLVPTRPVELHLIVQDLHDRLTARRQEELLQVVREHCRRSQAQPEPQQNDVDKPKSASEAKKNNTSNETTTNGAAAGPQNGEKRPLNDDGGGGGSNPESKPAAVINGDHYYLPEGSPHKKSRPR